MFDYTKSSLSEAPIIVKKMIRVLEINQFNRSLNKEIDNMKIDYTN